MVSVFLCIKTTNPYNYVFNGFNFIMYFIRLAMYSLTILAIIVIIFVVFATHREYFALGSYDPNLYSSEITRRP